MDKKEFDVLVEELFKECSETLEAKGNDYATESDRFETTKLIAQCTGLPVHKVICVFLAKHIITVLRGKSTSEPMRKRRIDAINYLGMLEAWDGMQSAEEKKKKGWWKRFYLKFVAGE